MRGLTLSLAFALGFAGAAAAQTATPSAVSPLWGGTPVGIDASPPAAPPPLPPRADGKPPDLAFGAYQRGNFLVALNEAERRIDDPKDAAAMTLIGEIYHDGAAVGKNDLEASRWYRLASNLGDPQAAYELGVMLLAGADGVPKDPAGAKEQFERAAARNHAGALYNLGVMALDLTNGRKPDFAAAAQYFLKRPKPATTTAEAVRILRIAAAKGSPIAQNRIAHLYVAGRVVERDLAKAAAWNAFAEAGGLTDQGLDVATANLTVDERSRFTRIVRSQIGD